MMLRLCAATLLALFAWGCPEKPAEAPAAEAPAAAEPAIDEEAIRAEAAKEAAAITKDNAEAEAARLEAELAGDE